MKSNQSPYYKDHFFIIFLGLILIRAFFNGFLPLMDKTEARYAEIARLMVETGNWVTPQIDYNISFWAKPPLSTWASASSLYFFGNHEFFVRLPYLLVIIAICLFVSRYRNDSKESPFLIGAILLTLPEFYLHGGVVSTDTFLLLSITLMFLSFWEALQTDAKPYWGYLFFVGLGAGLLAKGPIVGILTLPPIFIWLLWTKNVFCALRKAPWVWGIAILLLISLPWYLWNELRSPGFLDYFIVGEHFERYFNSNWKGDKYGFPKQQPLGIAWGFLLLFLVPWSWMIIRKYFSHFKKIINHPWLLFLSLWMLWTPLFFSVSKSLIHPYILPSTVPAALLVSHYWKSMRYFKPILYCAAFLPVLLLCIALMGGAKSMYENATDKYLLQKASKVQPLFSLNHKTYSSQFYSNGKIAVIDSFQLEQHIQNQFPLSILIEHRQWKSLSDSIKTRLISLAQHSKRGLYTTEFLPKKP